MLPYGKQSIDDRDIQAVVRVLQSDWLTTGPMVDRFEVAFANTCGVANAVAVSNGTAALHAAMYAAEIGPGDEVIVPAISFVATANAVLYQQADVVFADVDPHTLTLDPADVRRKITSRTRAVVAMDYAGQPCDYVALKEIAAEFNLLVIADACHSLGGRWMEKPVGSLADFSCFSLHPVKPITAGEGGVITTANSQWAEKMRVFRNHGIDQDSHQRAELVQHRYDMTDLGFNLRLTDLQCALALSQLGKLDSFIERRNQIANLYEDLLGQTPAVHTLRRKRNTGHAYHLFVIEWNESVAGITRDQAFTQLRKRGIGVNVHYRPIYQHSYYRDLMGATDHRCPNADAAYERILSLPIFPEMTDGDVVRVVRALERIAAVGRESRSAA